MMKSSVTDAVNKSFRIWHGIARMISCNVRSESGVVAYISKMVESRLGSSRGVPLSAFRVSRNISAERCLRSLMSY